MQSITSLTRNKIIRRVLGQVPSVIPHLTGKARFIALAFSADEKTAEQFDARLTSLVKALYKGTITAPQFVDALAALISRQITLAYRDAWRDEGEGAYPEYLGEASDAAIVAQFDFVDQFARDIVDARIDKKPIDGLLSRVPLWANRYTENYNEAVALIIQNGGGNLVWNLGATEEHCPMCSAFNGIVARASEWIELGIAPQNAPNPALTGEINGEKGCEGWHCDCSLTPTDKRRTAGAYGKLEEILFSK